MVEPWKISGRLGNQMFQIAHIYAEWKNGVIPDIYVQSDEYFRDYEYEIKNLYGAGIVPINQVAIHVRRGDYVGNPFYVNLMETPYYRDAMALFPDEEFLVFSDDIEWCKKQPIFKHCDFSEGDEITDFNRMAGCKGIIMANSSFSWWASYLSNGKVIAPKEWYTDGVIRTTTLDKWTKL